MDGCTWTCSVCHTAFPQLTKTKYLCPNRCHCICSSVSVWRLEFQHIVVTIREAITSLLPSHKGAHCVCKKQNSVVDQYQRLKDYFAWLSKFMRLFWKGRKKNKKKQKLCSPLHSEGTSDLFSSPLTGILDCSAMDDSAPSARYLKPKKACFSRRGKRMTMQGHYSIF